MLSKSSRLLLTFVITLFSVVKGFAQTSPTVYTDKPDYHPGDTVIIQGDGWLAGEQVKLEIDHSTVTHGSTVLYATANEAGHIYNNEFVIQPVHFGEYFSLSAAGQLSGLTATTTFTDAETQPAAQTLPYSQNFSTLLHTSTTYPAGWQGWKLATQSSTAFRVNSATGDESLNANSSASTAATGVHNFNGKIGILAGGSGTTDPAIVLALNTTGATGINLTFTLMTVRNPYDGSTNTRLNQVDVQYRVGTTGSFTSISGLANGVYQNTMTTQIGSGVTTPQNEQTFTYTLPAACNNQSVVQIRWVQKDGASTAGSRPSFAIDDVNATTCSKPTITTQPSDQTKTYGNDAQFTFSTSAANYQWQVSTNNGSSWTNISDDAIYTGATTNQLTVKKSPYSFNSYQYRCVASATCDATLKQTSNAVLLTASQQAITVTADVKSKTYGNADPALTYQITSGTLVTGDNFTGAISRVSGENVAGSPYAIQQGTLALSNNYALTFVGANFTINPAPATISLSNLSKTYNGSPQTATVTTSPTGLANIVTYNNSSTAPTNAASYTVVAKLNDPNYTGSDATGTLVIDKATPLLTWANPASIKYGTALSATQLNASATVPGNFVYTPASGSYLTAGTGQSLSVIFAPTDNTNYNNASATATIDVTKANATINVNGYSNVYDAAAHGATGTATGARGEDLTTYLHLGSNFTNVPGGTASWTFDGDANHNPTGGNATITITQATPVVSATGGNFTYNGNAQAGSGTATGVNNATLAPVSLSYSGTSGTAYGPTNTAPIAAGSYTVTASFAGTTNYTANTSAPVSLIIGQRAITITADAKSKIYGASDPVLTAQVTAGSAVNGETPSGSLTRASGETAGAYAIGQNTYTYGSNYVETFVGANFNVTQKDLIVTADAQTKVYGDADPALTFTATGLVGTDALTGNLVRATGNDAGQYLIGQGSLANANYNIIFTPNVYLSITPKPLAPSFTAADKTYDRTATATINSRNLAGILYSDDVSLGTSATVAFDSKEAGNNKTVTATGFSLSGTKAGNYSLASTSATATASILQKALIGTITAADKTYNGNASANITDRNLAGVIALDVVNYTGGTASFDNASVGNNKTVTATGLSLTGVDAGNYSVNATAIATASITAKGLTAVITATDKIYDGTAKATATAQPLNGIEGNDDVSVVVSNTQFDNKNVGNNKTVTVSVALTGAQAGNYNLSATAASAQANITALGITGSITANNKTYDGTTTASIATRSLTGVLGTDDVTYIAGSATFADKNVANGKTVSATGLSLSGADANNYTVNSTASTTANITALGITGNFTASDKIYDGNTNASVETRTLNGTIAGDNISLAGGIASFDTKNVGKSKIVTLTGATLSGTDASNYNLGSVGTTVADINAKALTVSATGINKTYDGNTTAMVTLSDTRIPGDLLMLNYGSASFADKNIGTGKQVNVSNIVVSGTDAANYSANNVATTTADITARGLIATAVGVNKVYDGTDAATVTFTDDRATGDVLTVTYTGATFNNKNVGSDKPVNVVGIAIGGTDASNYSVNTTASATADITARALIVSATGISKIYDGTTAATVSLSDNRITGDVLSETYTTASFADKNVGSSKAVSVSGITLSGLDAGNYTVNTGANTTADITVKTASVTPDAAGKVYTAVEPTLTGTLNGFIAADGITVTYSRTAGEKVAGSPYTINAVLSPADALSNYSITYNTAPFTISAKGLTVSATGINKEYDGNTAATVALSTDKARSDAVTATYTSASFDDKNVGTSKAVNVSGISISGADAGNYTLLNITAGATADIWAKALTVSATGQNKVYDGTSSATVTLSDDRIAGDVLTLGYTAALFGDKNAGIGKAISVSGITVSGKDAGNYMANNIAATAATITAKPASVSPAATGKVYGAAEPLFTGSLAGFIAADNITANYSRTAGETVAGNPYVISATLSPINALNNYDITYNTSAFNITARALTVSASGVNKVYDGTSAATVILGTDKLDADDVTAAYTGASFNNKSVGAGKPVGVSGISISGTNAGNYSLANTTASTAANITAKALTVSATASNKVYDGTTSASVNLSDDRITGDAFTINYTSSIFADKNVSNGKTVTVSGISLSGNDAANYSANTVATTTANITARSLAVSATGVNKIYDGNATATVTLSDNRVSGDALNTGYATAFFVDKNVGTGKAVSVNGITVAGTDVSNYTFNTTTATTANITARALMVSATGIDKVYDGKTNATVTLSDNRVKDDALMTAYTTAVFNNKNVGNGKSITVSGISITGADAGNYTFNATTNTTASITSRALTIGAAGINKVYDGNATATVTLSDNRVNGDALTLAYSNAMFDNKNVGTGKNVSVNSITVNGTDAGNYTANTSATTTADITPKALTVTASNTSKVFGTTQVFVGTEFTTNGLVSSDAVTSVSLNSLGSPSTALVGPYSIVINDAAGAGLSNYTIGYTNGTLNVTIANVVTSVTAPSAQQYSDVVTLSTRITGGAVGGQNAAQSVTFKIGTQTMNTTPVAFTIDGNDLVASWTGNLVEGSATGGNMSPGNKTVYAVFNLPNSNYSFSNNPSTTPLTITQENADVVYTGQDYIALPSTTATSVTVSLSATVRDLFPNSDGNRGNIKNARVTFRRDNPSTGAILGTANLPVALVADSTVGTVSTSFSYTLSNTEQQAGGANLQVYAVVDNYYKGGTSDVTTEITIARPGTDFVTGGGYLVNTSSKGTIAGTPGLKTNFGFNMQYNKSGANLKGQCNIIVRSGGKIYQIKSNAVNTLVVYASTPTGTQAYFNTKANYSDITDPNNPISLGGNMDLTVKMNDVSTGGQGDQASILMQNPNTSELIFTSNWDGVQTALQNLGGGNVSVRSTPSSTVPSAAPAMTLAPVSEQLKIALTPLDVRVANNPATTHFDLQLSGSNEGINLVIVNINGEVVEARQNLQAGTTVRVGDKLMTGIYFLQVMQGKNKKQIKLIKF